MQLYSRPIQLILGLLINCADVLFYIVTSIICFAVDMIRILIRPYCDNTEAGKKQYRTILCNVNIFAVTYCTMKNQSL